MTDTPENAIPSLHLYAQFAQHSEAFLVGTREALRHLHERLGELLNEDGLSFSPDERPPEQQRKAQFFANDGEGYELHLILCETEEDMDAYATPYTWEAAQDEHEPSGNPRWPRKRGR